MFSEALKMMDDNMYQYMADQHMALLKQRKAEIWEQQTEIQNQQTEIQTLYKIIIDQMKQNNDTKETAVSKLQDTCHLSLEQAEDLIEKIGDFLSKMKKYAV